MTYFSIPFSILSRTLARVFLSPRLFFMREIVSTPSGSTRSESVQNGSKDKSIANA